MTLDTERIASSARSVVCVDFDLTLVEWGELDVIPKPLPGAVEAVRTLQAAGYEVVIFTSRLSPTWWAAHVGNGETRDIEDFGWQQGAIVRQALDAMGLPGLRVTAEKVPAVAYIDDRAITFRDWSEAISSLCPWLPKPVQDQPPPIPSDRPAVWDLVIGDMRSRDEVGRARYGTPLQPHNGRDALVDAYQEALDLVAYLRQAIAERDGR